GRAYLARLQRGPGRSLEGMLPGPAVALLARLSARLEGAVGLGAGGGLSADGLGRALRRWPSYRPPGRAVLGEIRAVYATFLHREVSPRELLEHLDCFQSRWPSRAERARVIRAGRVRPYLGVRPLYAEVDITNQCNIRCKMCHFSDPSVS